MTPDSPDSDREQNIDVISLVKMRNPSQSRPLVDVFSSEWMSYFCRRTSAFFHKLSQIGWDYLKLDEGYRLAYRELARSRQKQHAPFFRVRLVKVWNFWSSSPKTKAISKRSLMRRVATGVIPTNAGDRAVDLSLTGALNGA